MSTGATGEAVNARQASGPPPVLCRLCGLPLRKAIEAMDNVEVADYPGDIANIMLSKSFVFNSGDEAAFETTLFQLRTFCEKHLKCAEPGMTVAEMLNASVNAEFLGDVKWQQDKRDESGETFNAEIGRTAPVE